MKFNKIYLLFSINITIIVLIFVAVEIGSSIGLKMIPLMAGVANSGTLNILRMDARINSPTYKDKNNAETIFSDFKKIQEIYTPYSMWEYSQINTHAINILENSSRKVCYPDEKSESGIQESENKKIFIFGGSTLWGVGADDCHTIPSLLSKIISENIKTRKYKIVNFGIPGHTSTQELVKLIVEIRHNNIPDYVIFYDGVNDTVTGAYRPGIAGSHQQYHYIANKFDRNGFMGLLYSSHTIKLLGYFHERWLRRNDEAYLLSLEEKAEKTAMVYKANVQMLDALSIQYGFKYYAFWQPELLTSNKIKTKYERNLEENSGNLIPVYKSVSNKIRQLDFTGYKFANLSDIFVENQQDIFIDFCHMGPDGNEVVSESIFAIIRDDI